MAKKKIIPMNFSYGKHGLPGTKATTFEEIFEGKRRSTLRKAGAHGLKIGDVADVRDKAGNLGEIKITGIRKVDASMADELSKTERWKPSFIKDYIKSGNWEQISYEPTSKPTVPQKGIRVISGGQIGADRIGLEEAKKLGFQTGGTAPKRYHTSRGSDLSLKDYGLTEISDADTTSYQGREKFYGPRTEQNVKKSDITLIYTVEGKEDSPGSRLTRNLAKKHNKPFLQNPTPDQVSNLVSELGKKDITINVAGNREYTNRKAISQGLQAAANPESAIAKPKGTKIRRISQGEKVTILITGPHRGSFDLSEAASTVERAQKKYGKKNVFVTHDANIKNYVSREVAKLGKKHGWNVEAKQVSQYGKDGAKTRSLERSKAISAGKMHHFSFSEKGKFSYQTPEKVYRRDWDAHYKKIKSETVKSPITGKEVKKYPQSTFKKDGTLISKATSSMNRPIDKLISDIEVEKDPVIQEEGIKYLEEKDKQWIEKQKKQGVKNPKPVLSEFHKQELDRIRQGNKGGTVIREGTEKTQYVHDTLEHHETPGVSPDDPKVKGLKSKGTLLTGHNVRKGRGAQSTWPVIEKQAKEIKDFQRDQRVKTVKLKLELRELKKFAKVFKKVRDLEKTSPKQAKKAAKTLLEKRLPDIMAGDALHEETGRLTRSKTSTYTSDVPLPLKKKPKRTTRPPIVKPPKSLLFLPFAAGAGLTIEAYSEGTLRAAETERAYKASGTGPSFWKGPIKIEPFPRPLAQKSKLKYKFSA